MLLVAHLLATPVFAAEAPIAPPLPATTDCAQSRALPAGADQNSRRIACQIPPKYQQDVAMAEFIGGMIRMHDIAAWLTTDALLAKGAFEGVEGEGRGWLTFETDGKIEVRYFWESRGNVAAVATATLDMASMEVEDARKLSPAEPLTDRESRLMKSRDAALHTPELGMCTKHAPNTLAFESNLDGRPEILVFVMSAWKDNHAAPLGGFHLFRYSADGQTLQSQFSQTRSCPMANLDEKLPEGAQAVGMGVSHLTSATPTMFHVFMNLQYRQPLFVMTTQNGLHWRVEDGRIHLIERDDPADALAAPAPPVAPPVPTPEASSP
ncbi:hypothetical protein EER27_05935 [Lysobacter psychrotolerans]|uniref:Uncharacterized protein n=1 Tax=Montanilutibacter psychrotolerans TaxID=1327343 RepID=A0A3M8T3M4_9GAMM|nr:hypothetical protein EER27_05935 [Lysobacter psychrotolerans]